MNELQTVLQGLCEEDRQTLARELLAVLEGRREVSADRREKAAEANQASEYREAFDLMPVGTSEELFPVERSIEEKQRAERVQQVQEPGNSRLLPEKTEQRSWTAVHSGEEAGFTVLRRTVPGTKTVRETEIRSSLTEESSRGSAYHQMREISEYFRQDSHRYDAGFTRY